MLVFSIVLFVLAALLGHTVAIALLKKKKTSEPIAFLHGLLGASGLVLLILHAVRNPDQFLTIAIVLLVIAALGGGAPGRSARTASLMVTLTWTGRLACVPPRPASR